MPKLNEAGGKTAKKKTTVKKEKNEAPQKQAAEPKQERLQVAGLDEIDETLNILYYGDGGTGKTTDVATMANSGLVLFINSEAGVKRRPLQERGVEISNIRLFPDPRSGEELSFELLEKMYWQMKEDLEADPKSWAGTCWDSITEIHKKLLEQIVASQVLKAERMGKERDRFFIDRADYGVMTEQIRLLLRRFRDLPCHFAVTALERRDQDDDQKVSYGPSVTPALQGDLIGYVDVVVRTDVVEIGEHSEFQGLTRKQGKYKAKDRFDVLPIRMVDPTFERILQYVNDEIDEESDPVMQEARERREAFSAEAAAAAASK